ncbi:MAG: SDR family oxidoreductase [Candidatus Methylomirabilia bacterium]
MAGRETYRYPAGTPEDIARVIGLLCSDAAGWIVGQTLMVDGGMVAALARISGAAVGVR